MSTRKLFFGEKAIDSILEVSQNIDRQFIRLAQKRHNYVGDKFLPWMSVPEQLASQIAVPIWPNTNFLTGDELKITKNYIESLGNGKTSIPSMENYPIRVCLLSLAEDEVFRSRVSEAKSALISNLSWLDPIFQSLIFNFLPIESLSGDDMDFGMSTMWLRGVVFFEKNQIRPLNLRIENLAHELAHQILINYQLSDRLIVGDLNKSIYSAIRKTDRPAIMSFHGAAALTYMLIVARSLNDRDRIEIISNDLKSTLRGLSEIHFTPVGETIFKEMCEYLG